ncbi:MAG TPA: MFS transporter [Gammaproteobacteria bacterium]|nr:MFS transporter [Gammaproteobacteria bacterium]
MTQLDLLRQRRFSALFTTQFLGAFNDNVYKNALIIFITFEAARDAAARAMLVTVSAGVFILPFVLFSAWAGQIADKLEKSALIRAIKLAEIAIMVLAAIAFALGSTIMLIALLFLMGTQSAFFGPLKYGILPQLLEKTELVAGNGLIQMATFVAILVGMILGGKVAAIPEAGPLVVGGTIIALALLGWLSSLGVPRAGAAEPSLSVDRGPWPSMFTGMAYARETPGVFAAILGVSWFWFLGATFLQLLPAYGRDTLNGNPDVIIMLLTCFTIGIGLGALICARLSGKKINLRLVPVGAVGMTVFGLGPLLFLDSPSDTIDSLQGITEVLAYPGNRVAIASFIGLAVSGGVFIVPLYTYVQANSALSRRARVIAANNIINSLLMVVSALLTLGALGVGMSIPQIFAAVAVLNLFYTLIVIGALARFESRHTRAESPSRT